MTDPSKAAQVNLRPMTLADLPQVEALDRQAFPTPWPENAFRYELTRNPHAICWVAEQSGRLVGDVVVWLVVDEAHIATLAVQGDLRQHGIGQKLLARALLLCHESGATSAMLEVRESNLAAQGLYDKFGFEQVGLRKGYYQDTHEDAILMTLAPLQPDRLARLEQMEDETNANG
ncbi:MAG: ribosomal protein S18-alanine N-acetyltransferase [Chloroflexota bacterium]|nr:ribosomal protein S18-alanine N-acetyltransferase [Chloroflexota bacterium]